MLSKIEKSALELTGLKQQTKESRQKFLKRIFVALDNLFSDDGTKESRKEANENWERATDEVQHWFDKACEVDKGDELADFPDVKAAKDVKASKEDDTSKDDEEDEDAAEEGAEAEDAEAEGDTEPEETEETETKPKPKVEAKSESADEKEDEEEEMATNNKKKAAANGRKTKTNGKAKGKAKGKAVASAKNVKAEKAVKAEKPAKTAKKKRTAKGNGEAFKKVGVMAEIKEMLQKPDGATVKEIVSHLTKKFPERPEKGMEISTRAFIYVGGPKELKGKKLKKTSDEKRGNVYKFPANA